MVKLGTETDWTQRFYGWLDAMETTAGGRLMLSNLRFALGANRPSVEALREILIATIAAWVPESGSRPDTTLERVIDESLASCLCAPPPADRAACSRVVEAVTFVARYVDHAELGFGIRDEVPDALLTLIQRGLPGEAVRDEAIRGRRPLAWVTKSAEIAKLRESYDGDLLATAIRDQLGLSHYGRDELLLEVRYPEAVYQTLEYVAPTFVEGGAGVVFRAARHDDKWGRAVNLNTLEDGLPEAVHRPIPFTRDFTVTRLGRLLSDPGFDFGRLIALSPQPWDRRHNDLLPFALECIGACGE